MTTDAEIQQQIYQYFLIEAPELMQKIEQDLYQLLAGHSVELVHNLMRNAHTLKGSAASVGKTTIKTIAHHLEDVFKSLYDPNIEFDSELSGLLIEGFECLKLPLTAEINGLPYDEEEILDRTATVFARLQNKLGDFFGQEAPVLSSADLGYDVVAAIFQDSIPEELNQLEVVINRGDEQEIRSTLQQQAEFFLGIAQSYNLPTWQNCAQQVLDMLSTQPEPETLKMMAQVALENYRQICQEIVAGNRGTPAPAQQVVTGEEPQKSEPTSIAVAQTTSVKPQPTVEKVAEEAAEVKTVLTVRVPIEQLENLNYDLGELLINFNQQSLNNEQIGATTKNSLLVLYDCREKLRRVKDWSDRYLAGTVNIAFRAGQFDSLEMDQYGELHILLQATLESMSALEEKLEDVNSLLQIGQLTLKKQKRILADAQEHLVQARTVPLVTLLERFPPMVQQLAHSYKKRVELQITGNPTLVDKGIVEQLYEPLLHLIRNAFDHGIETPEVRRQKGKPETGKIVIHTEHFGNRITIQVKDDGQGINWQRIRQKGIEKGLISETDRLSPEELAELLFVPGFSTASQLSELSGRGVGLDVVRSKLKTIESSISLHSEVDIGTTFTLEIPVNLTTLNLLVCQSQGIPYGFLIDSIHQILLPLPEQIQIQNHKRLLTFNGQLLPILSLADLITYNRTNPYVVGANTSLQAGFYALGKQQAKPVLILKNQNFCLEVDQILAEQELVLKSFRPLPRLLPYLLGYTVLGDGKYTLVIDTDRLIYRSATSASLPVTAKKLALAPPVEETKIESSIGALPPETFELGKLRDYLILLIDDSITQRQSMLLTLEKANMRAIQARDGYEGLEQISQNPTVDLIICDIEMPRMNGFEFLQAYRNNPHLKQVPVIMLTSRSSEKHRQTAMELGATAYMTKPYKDQELIAQIQTLVG
ncbi:MAG: hybrid sensor histidine kinase/response regulator [Pseudanabaenaceae cyanobacterium SKYGB_i_bin29]|nr:hybrid sensor histidine kinase/response regulator [Pseudanabaenaceae cyanobacterium SKYG29]MDW8422493.1 hybrid sensor histidine kinase/response regulator [Pseudanabaenaceae cyanobacterium SKYGB_i_bin29]